VVDARGSQNRTQFIVIGVLIALMAAGSLIATKSSPKPTTNPPDTARAVVVPTTNGATTVVVPPCNVKLDGVIADAEAGRATPDTVRFELPQGQKSKSVLVPHCNATTGAATASGDLPDAAFVLSGASGDYPGIQALMLGAQLQVLVPTGNTVKTVVVPPCSGKPTQARKLGQDSVVAPRTPSSNTAIAPPC
jgi:hypothetical protein